MMPDFIVIGTQRGGTTSFYHYLTQHPSVAPASTKEVHFFDVSFQKGVWWYRAHFPLLLRRRYAESRLQQPFITGEASPYYLFHPLVPQRIVQTMPHVKLIALLRNPVDRAYSQYRLELDWGFETRTFEDAVASEEMRNGDKGDQLVAEGARQGFNYRHHTYLSRGIYVDQLQRWLSLFPPEQLLILKSEDFYEAPAATLKQTLDFLHLPSTQPSQMSAADYDPHDGYSRLRQTKRSVSSMTPALRQQLYAYFAPHNARLYELLGKDLGWESMVESPSSSR
jgi:hypothetical protein